MIFQNQYCTIHIEDQHHGRTLYVLTGNDGKKFFNPDLEILLLQSEMCEEGREVTLRELECEVLAK